MGCGATVWVDNTIRCLACWGQDAKPRGTPCPGAGQMAVMADETVAYAVSEALRSHATHFEFRPNGGGYAWTLMRLWLRNADGWRSTKISFASDTDRGETYAVERALEAAGINRA